jgi:hypothetical protein
MTRAQFKGYVRAASATLTELGLLQFISELGSLSVGGDFKASARDPAIAYEKLYLLGLSNQEYNFILNDYAYYQFYADGESGEELRYAYYPCPYDISIVESVVLQEDVMAGVIDLEAVDQILSEADLSHRAPTVRFDVSFQQYVECAHACAHFHIGHQVQDRWACNQVLTPLAFALIVTRAYYGESWFAGGVRIGGSQGYKNGYDLRVVNALAECAPLGEGRFTPLERRILHFG